MSHANGRLTPAGRLIMVQRIGSGRAVAHVAAERGISRTTAWRCWCRFREHGTAGLVGGASTAAGSALRGQRVRLPPLRRVQSRDRHARHQAALHQAALPLDQRESGTPEPHSRHRVGLRPPLDLQRRPQSRLDDLARPLQPRQSPPRHRRQDPHRPNRQRSRPVHLGPANTPITAQPQRAGLVPNGTNGVPPIVPPLLASAAALSIAIVSVLSMMRVLPWQRRLG